MSKRKQPRRVTRVARARSGYFAGLLLASAGLAMALAVGWGLVAAGVGLVAYFTLLYDVDDPPPHDDEEAVRYR
jgi:hypothetical protein